MNQNQMMKIMDTPYKILLCVVLTLTTIVGIAQEKVSKTIERNFELNENGELHIENKYGNINFTGWEQNKIKIVASIKVNHRKKESAKELLNRIKVEVNSNNSYASIASVIANRNSGWFADFFNKNNPIDAERSRVQIDYEIFLPKKASLEVSNRFGDVFIDDWIGQLTIDLEHGDLWIGDNINKATIKLEFGKLRARDLSYANITLKNGELTMENSKNLRLLTEGSEIKIGKVNTLELNANKDEILINDVGSVFGASKFATLIIEKLLVDVDLNLKISDFVIYSIEEQNVEINLEQESSDITLHITKFPHHLNVILEEGVVRLPKSYTNVSSTMLNKGKKLRNIEASFGKNKTGQITIKGIKGIVTIND